MTPPHRRTLPEVEPAAIRRVLDRLRSLPEGPIEAWWQAFPRSDWAALFRLIDIGADLPRIAGNQTLAALPGAQWPALSQVAGDLGRIQRLVDEPIVPAETTAVEAFTDPVAAAARLDDHHCVTLDHWLGAAAQRRLDEAVDTLRPDKDGSWGALGEDESPEIHQVIREALAGDAFRRITAWDPDRDRFSLTLSLQTLAPTGIGWHRDLYWPREWVGHDVFAVFLALGSDGPEKGGAFVYYLPWHDQVYAFYRRRHQATILWNSADHEGRILHAVAGYHGDDTERHLLIVQGLRH